MLPVGDRKHHFQVANIAWVRCNRGTSDPVIFSPKDYQSQVLAIDIVGLNGTHIQGYAGATLHRQIGHRPLKNRRIAGHQILCTPTGNQCYQ